MGEKDLSNPQIGAMFYEEMLDFFFPLSLFLFWQELGKSPACLDFSKDLFLKGLHMLGGKAVSVSTRPGW
jgi:hypothetical protein